MVTPAPIVTSPVAQIVLAGRLAAAGGNSSPCGNVFYYRCLNVVPVINKANLTTIFRTTVIVPLLAATNVRYAPTQTIVRMLSDATDPQFPTVQAGTGAIVTDSEPSDDAVVVVLNTGIRGKNARGFKHFGGTSEVDTLGDILVGAGLANWQTVAASLFATMTDAGGMIWQPMVFSPFMSQIKVNPTVIRGYDIVSATLDKDIRTMRKRKTKPAVH